MPLDENFPTYHFHHPDRKASPHITSIAFTTPGLPSQPVYTLTRSLDSRNTYSTALTDALFPAITYCTLSTTLTPASPDLRPRTITLELHNPDSAVTLTHRHAPLRGSSWEFSLPTTSFPRPSAAGIDAEYVPPAGERRTFRWRKEGGVISRAQLRCSLVAGGGEPDTVVAVYVGVGDAKGRAGMWVYESNFRRVGVQDLKGLELTMLVAARTIDDVWFGNIERSFNLPRARAASLPAPPPPPPVAPATTTPQGGCFAERARERALVRAPPPPPPPEDDRIEREQAAIRNMLAEEEAKRQAAIDAETQRLRRLYEQENQQRRNSRPMSPPARPQRTSTPQQPPRPVQTRPPVVGGGGSGSFLSPTGGGGQRLSDKSRRKSFLGLSFGGSGSGKLSKKQSSMW